MHSGGLTIHGREKLISRPSFFLVGTFLILGPAFFVGWKLAGTLRPHIVAHRQTRQIRWMPFFADLEFFRQSVDADGEYALLVYSARGDVLKSSLDHIPLHPMESWRPDADSGSLRAVTFLARKFGMQADFLPHPAAHALLYCHSPFEAPGARRHWSFAIADTTAGRLWIGRSWSVSESRSLALEAFYQAANGQFDRAERSEVARKARFLESRARDEPMLAVLNALRTLQDRYISGNPYSPSSYGEGSFEAAIGIQAEALRRHPDFCMGHARQARYYASLGAFPAARAELGRAGACGEDIQVFAAQAQVHLLAGEDDSVRSAVRRLEEGSFPEAAFYDFDEIPLILAQREGNSIAAEKYYNRRIHRNPRSPQGYGNFADYLAQEYRFDEAAVLCHKLASIGSYPLGTRVCEEAGRKQSRYGEKQGLLHTYRILTARLEESGNALTIRAERARRLEVSPIYSLALEDWDYLLERAPESAFAEAKIRILDRLGRFSEADSACRGFARKNLRSGGLDAACGAAQIHGGRPEKAKRYLLGSIADRTNALVPLYLGFLDGDSAGGAAEALRRDSTAEEAWAVKGELALSSGNFTEAEADFAHALAAEDANPDWLSGRGIALQRLGKTDAALPCLNRALAMNRTHARSLRARIAAYRALSADGLAFADFRALTRSGQACHRDSAEFREWMESGRVDTLRLSREPLFFMKSGFTRNILEGYAVDCPARISLRSMRNRRIYLRMSLSNVKGRHYDYTYRIRDGKGSIQETGDLSVSIHGNHFQQWFSYRFGQPGEVPGNWRFDLVWNGQLAAAQTIRVEP